MLFIKEFTIEHMYYIGCKRWSKRAYESCGKHLFMFMSPPNNQELGSFAHQFQPQAGALDLIHLALLSTAWEDKPYTPVDNVKQNL